MTYLFWISVVVAAQAVLVAAIPRRMLWGALLAWVFSPVVVYFTIIGWELLTRPGVSYPAGTALYGLMLISPIIAPPWLGLCLVGFGVGSGILRVLRPPSNRPPVAYQPPLSQRPRRFLSLPHLRQTWQRTRVAPQRGDRRLSPIT